MLFTYSYIYILLFLIVGLKNYPYVVYISLTFTVRSSDYSEHTESIPWQLIPWLLAVPGHQQQRYWLCNIGRLSCVRKYFNHLCLLNILRNEIHICIFISSKCSTHKGFRTIIVNDPFQIKYFVMILVLESPICVAFFLHGDANCEKGLLKGFSMIQWCDDSWGFLLTGPWGMR